MWKYADLHLERATSHLTALLAHKKPVDGGREADIRGWGVEQSYLFESRTRETCEGGVTKEVPRILCLILVQPLALWRS